MALDDYNIITELVDPVRLPTRTEFDRLTGKDYENTHRPHHVPDGAETPVLLSGGDINMNKLGLPLQDEWSPSWCIDREVLRATYDYVCRLQAKVHPQTTVRSFESHRRLRLRTFTLSVLARGRARSTYDDNELKQLVTRFEFSDRSGYMDFSYTVFHDFRLFEVPLGCFKVYDDEPIIDLEKIKARRATVAHRWRKVREAVATRPIVFLLQNLAAQRRARPDGAVARISMHVELGNVEEEARARRELRAELFESQSRLLLGKRKFDEIHLAVEAREAELLA